MALTGNNDRNKTLKHQELQEERKRPIHQTYPSRRCQGNHENNRNAHPSFQGTDLSSPGLFSFGNCLRILLIAACTLGSILGGGLTLSSGARWISVF